MAGLVDFYIGRAGGIEGLDQEFNQRLLAMLLAAPDSVRSSVKIISAYRSPERQAQLWKDALAKYGSESEARRWVAPPGRSNHNHGLAIDLRYSTNAARTWFHQNAERFQLRFPMEHEPWHIEPIGVREGTYKSSTDDAFTVDPEAYTDGQGLIQENNNSLETQLLRVANRLGQGSYNARTQVSLTDPNRLADRNAGITNDPTLPTQGLNQ